MDSDVLKYTLLIDIPNIFSSFLTAIMQKISPQNAGSGILVLYFLRFPRDIPTDPPNSSRRGRLSGKLTSSPLEFLTPYARVKNLLDDVMI